MARVWHTNHTRVHVHTVLLMRMSLTQHTCTCIDRPADAHVADAAYQAVPKSNSGGHVRGLQGASRDMVWSTVAKFMVW